MRKICYVSGTRADFGLMRKTLQAIAADRGFDLGILVTGMHLDPFYGLTVNEIRQENLPIIAEVPVPLEPSTGGTMARNIGRAVQAFTDILEDRPPDLVLLLGDRGEMLAGAIAAVHLNIPIAHVHGGELSGTVDECVRHAISKLAHLHFTATENGRRRLIRMGEKPDKVFAVGAPGLDSLFDHDPVPRDQIMHRFGLDPSGKFALMVYHPVLQEAELAGRDAEVQLESLRRRNLQTLALMPNSDAGSFGVRSALERVRGESWISVQTHLTRPDFISAMAAADVMIGNSSAAIIESASFGTPVVNVGPRQNHRERNGNVRDVVCEPNALDEALQRALQLGRFPCSNIYGDGKATERMIELLRTLALTPELLQKVNEY